MSQQHFQSCKHCLFDCVWMGFTCCVCWFYRVYAESVCCRHTHQNLTAAFATHPGLNEPSTSHSIPLVPPLIDFWQVAPTQSETSQLKKHECKGVLCMHAITPCWESCKTWCSKYTTCATVYRNPQHKELNTRSRMLTIVTFCRQIYQPQHSLLLMDDVECLKILNVTETLARAISFRSAGWCVSPAVHCSAGPSDHGSRAVRFKLQTF